ncbi:MAG: potassium transporter, partial [Thermotogae bacterium]
MSDYLSVVVRRFRIVLWNVGTLFTWFSAILLFPLVFLIFYPEEIHYALGFVESAVLSFIFGIAMKLVSGIKESHVITVQEGAVIVLFSWIFAIFFSALPFIFMKILNFSQAVFEATSGWTTTGLTMITDVTKIPRIF